MNRLTKTEKGRSDIELPTVWAAEIQTLTAQFGQLFIFAHTAVMYILSESHQPAKRLKDLYNTKGSTPEQGRYGLDQLSLSAIRRLRAHLHLNLKSFPACARHGTQRICCPLSFMIPPSSVDISGYSMSSA
ncbi:hypothetical protein C0991_010450, partial [Blastosporella zonata]